MLVSSKKSKKKNAQGFNLKVFLKTKKGKRIFMSVIAGMAIIIAANQIASLTGNSNVQMFGILGGVMAMVIPASITQITENKRRDSIDSNLPIFLLSLVSAVQSGSSLLRSVEEAADRNMGSLTPELKNLRANISWGMPYHEAFDQFTKRVGTKLAKRVGILLQISMDIGGDVGSTLELIQHHVSEMQNIEKDRKAALQPYIFTIYISFVVFIAITVILVSQFFTEIEAVQLQLIKTAEESDIPLGMFGAILGVRVSEINGIMFHMAIIEAVFGGLAAGKIGESSFIGGIKHIIVMIILAIVAFYAMGAI